MASQQAYYKQIFSKPKPQANTMGMNFSIGNLDPNAGRVVVDPYSNKYYGQEDKKAYLSHYDSQIKSLQDTIKRGYHPQSQNETRAWFGNMGYQAPKKLSEDDIVNFNKQVEELTQQRQSFDQNYVQKDRFFESYDAYKDQWNNYFEASYRNPRQEAEGKQLAATLTNQARAQQEDAANKAQLVSANQLEVNPPRQVGTGVDTTRDTQVNQLIAKGGTGLGI